MLRKLAICLVAIMVLLYLGGAALAAVGGDSSAHGYVGAEKCKMCHKGDAKGKVWEIWEASAHAKAYQTLVAKGDGSEKKAECLTCHVTGFGKPSGFVVGDSTKANLANVGCEACHGPGADYKGMAVMKDKAKAKEAGLIMPTEETCKGCHNDKSPTFKGFNFAEYGKKIEHKIPPKTQ